MIDIVLVTGRELYFVLPEVGDFVKNGDQSEKVFVEFWWRWQQKYLMLMDLIYVFV